MQRAAGRSVRKARRREHSMAMVSWRNTADGRPAACPEGVPQTTRLHVTALGKDSPFPACRALIQTACGALHVALFMKVLVSMKLNRLRNFSVKVFRNYSATCR